MEAKLCPTLKLIAAAVSRTDPAVCTAPLPPTFQHSTTNVNKSHKWRNLTTGTVWAYLLYKDMLQHLYKIWCTELQLVCPCIEGLYPQSPCHFAQQPSVPVSQTLRPSYLSHMTAAAT